MGKGMKWGVRKDKGYSTTINDGSLTIRKGSNIHRITSNPEEHNGHAYAAFTDKDVQHYKHSVTSWITEASDDFDSVRVFDMSMKVTKDLVAPNERKKIDTFIKLLSNDEFSNEIKNNM